MGGGSLDTTGGWGSVVYMGNVSTLSTVVMLCGARVCIIYAAHTHSRAHTHAHTQLHNHTQERERDMTRIVLQAMMLARQASSGRVRGAVGD